jgi:VWFA-related protein
MVAFLSKESMIDPQEDPVSLQFSRIFPCLMLCFLSTTSLSAQTQADSSTQTTFKATTREVIVDVVVTGGKGDAVNGLPKDQFQVLEDGKPQSIDFFEEHVSKSQLAGSLPAPPKMPPNVYSNVPPAPLDDAVNVLLLDSLNTPPPMSSYARKQILNFLNHVKPGTRMAIMTLNGTLNIVQGFTTDVALLREVALKQTTPGISPALVTQSEIQDEQGMESFISSNAATGPSGANSTPGDVSAGSTVATTAVLASAFADYQNYKADIRTQMTLEAFSNIASNLAAVPGRKNLIWFSGDFPIVVFPKFDQRMQYEDNQVSLKQVQKTADMLTNARIAVYPVFANGMMTDDNLSVEIAGPVVATGGPSILTLMSTTDKYAASSSARASLIASMNQIASDTGGKAIYNTNDIDTAIGQSVADGSHYYTLVYSPANKKMDGHYRKIEVKLADSKLKLSYRHGYNADEDTVLAKDSQKEADPLRRQLVHGTPDATQILFAARVVPLTPQPAAGGKMAGKNASLTGPTTRYAIDFMIRWSDLAWVDGGDGTHQGKLEAGLIAWDRKGKSVNWEEGSKQMAIPPDVYASMQKSGIPAHLEIDLPNTDLYLKLGVMDGRSGKAGTLEIPLHVTAANTTAQAANGQPQKTNEP